MANPTTNYGWPMPTSTDLVTDLPADFAAFGQPVDTSLKALNPETTLGDIAYRSATSNTNTRLGIGTAGQVLAVSGGVPAWTTTADVTPLTTKGDLFTFTTVDARIGVGANNTILTADSAEATGMKWAAPATGGGLTVIATGSLSGASVVISSIPATHKHLMLSIYNATWNTGAATFTVAYNSVITNYRRSIYAHTGTTANNSGAINQAAFYLSDGATDWLNTGGANHSNIMIYDYLNTTGTINAAATYNFVNAASAYCEATASFSNTATAVAITSLTLATLNGYTMTAGTYTLYGVS